MKSKRGKKQYTCLTWNCIHWVWLFGVHVSLLSGALWSLAEIKFASDIKRNNHTGLLFPLWSTHTHTAKRHTGHTKAHIYTHSETLSCSLLFSYKHRNTRRAKLFVCLWVAEWGALSVAACQGTRQLSPQMHPVLRGKVRWRRHPCFWGKLEFATLSWVTIHSRFNSRLTDVMFSLSYSFTLSLSFLLLSQVFLLSLYFFIVPTLGSWSFWRL